MPKTLVWRLVLNKILYPLLVVLFLASCKKKLGVTIPDYFPQENRVVFDTISPAHIALGERLFFDPRLSQDSSISCGSCHLPELAFTDGKTISHGIYRRHSRHNSSTLLNIGFSPSFMFDQRATDLEIQPMIPIHDTSEMNMTLPEIMNRLEKDRDINKLSFSAYNQPISSYNIMRSLAAYMRSLISSDSKYDHSITHQDSTILNDLEQKGKTLFFGKGGCNTCHTAPLFTNHLHYNLQMDTKDIGLMGATHHIEDKYRMKTPSLRNIAITSPYFHHGNISSLEEAITYHVSLERKSIDYSPPVLDSLDRVYLVYFLHSLTDSKYLSRAK